MTCRMGILAAALAGAGLALPAVAEDYPKYYALDPHCQPEEAQANLCHLSVDSLAIPSPADRDAVDEGTLYVEDGVLDLAPDPALPDTLPPAPRVGDRVEESRYTIIDEAQDYGLPSLPANERWVAISETVARVTAEDGFVLEVLD